MTSKPLSIVSVTAVGGIVGLLLVSLSGRGFDSSTARIALGWTLPLFSAAIAGGVSWLLLSDRDVTDPEVPVTTAHCGACGSAMVEDWRLCPYCGTLVCEAEAL